MNFRNKDDWVKERGIVGIIICVIYGILGFLVYLICVIFGICEMIGGISIGLDGIGMRMNIGEIDMFNW